MKDEPMASPEIIAAVNQLVSVASSMSPTRRLPSIEYIGNIEKVIGVKFSDDYKYFLLKVGRIDHGVIEPCTLFPEDGHTYLIEVHKDAKQLHGFPENSIPICQDNGDYYLLTRNGNVVFWSHNGTTNESWATLAEWIKEVWILESNKR